MIKVNLDNLLMSEDTYVAWQQVAESVGQILAERRIDPATVPDEQVWVEGDGSLTIYVTIPNFGEVSMSVPVGQWAYKHHS